MDKIEIGKILIGVIFGFFGFFYLRYILKDKNNPLFWHINRLSIHAIVLSFFLSIAILIDAVLKLYE